MMMMMMMVVVNMAMMAPFFPTIVTVIIFCAVQPVHCCVIEIGRMECNAVCFTMEMQLH